jgi:hypothetical protein
MTRRARNIVVFVLDGVLVDCDRRHLYHKLFGNNETAMEHFPAPGWTDQWNRVQDAGYRLAAVGLRKLNSCFSPNRLSPGR